MPVRFKGSILVIVSAVIYGFIPLLAKIVYANGGTSVTLVLLRAAIPIPVLWLMIRMTGRDWRIALNHVWPMLLLTVAAEGTQLLLFASYNYIPSGMATTLHFTYPVFVVVGCVLFCREKPTLIKLGCVCLCTMGIVLFYTPDGNASFEGIVLAFTSGIMYAFYIVYLSRSGLNELDPFVLVFWQFIFMTAETFLFLFVTDSLEFDLSPTGWLVAVVLAIIGSLVAVVCFQVGVKFVGPQRASVLSTFEPITSIVVGVLFFRESFGLETVIGSVFILAAVILLTVFDKEADILPKEETC